MKLLALDSQPSALDFAAAVAQLVERVLGKDEVKSSSLFSSFAHCGEAAAVDGSRLRSVHEFH